ncbi:hypothetical protein N7524_011792 [Penicillium chrysogenum]|nr:hypothetical protein N7524_011792 [Penicillium chrysogenum]
MATTVNHLMGTFSPQPVDTDSNSTLSQKQWTEDFFPIERQHVTLWPPTIRAIENFLGPGSATPSAADYLGLQTPANALNTHQELMSSEGDVTRDFDQNIIPPVALAFSGQSAWSCPRPESQPVIGAPMLWSRSLVGANGSSSSNARTVDYQMMMQHQVSSLDSAAMIGEMKKPRVIRRNEWTFQVGPSSSTLRLAQELRAYDPIVPFHLKCHFLTE